MKFALGIDCTISLLICRSALCPANKTKCPPPSSQCIDVTSQCDGRKDCYGGLDELQCGRCIVIVLQKHISLRFDETALGFQFINKCITSLFFVTYFISARKLLQNVFPLDTSTNIPIFTESIFFVLQSNWKGKLGRDWPKPLTLRQRNGSLFVPLTGMCRSASYCVSSWGIGKLRPRPFCSQKQHTCH